MSEKIGISQDERWPFFHISEKWGEAAEVDAETVARWRSVMAAFEEVQNEMEAVFEDAQARARREAEVAKAEKAVADAQARLDELRGT